MRFRIVVMTLIGAALMLANTAPLTAHASDLNAFTISSYKIDFVLGRDSDGASTLRTKETITADFSMDDVNHGIERYVPKSYDGHSVNVKIVSVTDGAGAKRTYETYDSGDYKVLRIGDKGTYVHGQQTYSIEYTQRNVTKTFADAGDDEFYWDTNGTEWRVPIDHLTVSLTVDPTLRGALNGQTNCLSGVYGDMSDCTLENDGDGHYTLSADDLGSGENITIVVAFKQGTFHYVMSIGERLLMYWGMLQAGCVAIAIAAYVFIKRRFNRWSKREDDIGTIVPEYLPPKNTSVSTSAVLMGRASVIMSAQLIDLAVRHYLKIYETKKGSFFFAAQYTIEIVKPIDDLLPEECEVLYDIFGKNGATVGQKRSTGDMRKNTKLGLALADNPGKARELMQGQYDLYKKSQQQVSWFRKAAGVLGILSVLTLSPIVAMPAIASFLLSFSLWPLSDKGVELKRYLEGLKLYIGVGEEERLKMLQSPEGAEKVSVDPTDTAQLVKLYERLLPYAIVFGQEKEWTKQLGTYYESANTTPGWYGGSNLGAFSAASFASGISSMTGAISSSGASSSSSSGTGGGGFSGGGGGGGGGGGW